MIGFVIGCMLGGIVGIFVTSLCVTAGHSDREMRCTDLEDDIR